MLNKIQLLILLLAVILINACKHDEVIEPQIFHYDYFPLEKGIWVVYTIDSTVWDNVNDSLINYSYQIKELVDTSFLDNTGKKAWRIERYKRKNNDSKWSIADVWYANNTGSTIEQIEEDNRIIKLAFPILSTTKWNANAYNTLGEQEYKYIDIHTSKTINSLQFDSTITVLQKPENSNLVNSSYEYEIYAKGVGLISKKHLFLYKNLIDTIEYSNYTYTIESFGK